MVMVHEQLGPERRWLHRSAWVVPATNTGWWNADSSTTQATIDRTGMSYTDDKTGKTATVTYTPFIE